MRWEGLGCEGREAGRGCWLTPTALDVGPELTAMLRERLHQIVCFHAVPLFGCVRGPSQSKLANPALARALPAFPSREQQSLVAACRGSECILQDFVHCLPPQNTAVKHWARRHVGPVRSIGVNKQKTHARNPKNLVLSWKTMCLQRTEEPFLRGCSAGCLCTQSQKGIPQVWLQKGDRYL